MVGSIVIPKELGFDYFLSYIGNKGKPKEECRTHLLLLDGHESNWNADMIEMAREHNVIILQFPLHLTHILQPLDSFYFLKVKIEIRKAKASKRYREVKTKWDIIHFLEESLYLASSSRTIHESFRIAGVWPPQFKEECISSQMDLQTFIQSQVK